MNKNIIALIVGAALLAGCGKSKAEVEAELAAVNKARAVAEEAARKAAGPTLEEKKQAAAAFITLVCSSPKLLDEAETSFDLFEAFSGEGADRVVAKNHFMKAQNFYRALLESELPARGASYKALMLYTDTLLVRKSALDLKEFRDLLKTHCRGVDEAQAEKVLTGILFYCTAPTPK
ncbi:MAG: hypothetical protein Q7R35_07045 [Elusimicrobiota bacterium]|nr:hypothetical protein [Elusimicrobiota bacterium]